MAEPWNLTETQRRQFRDAQAQRKIAEADGHFPGCHPEHEQGDRPEGRKPQDTEPCWHCGTATERGACGCLDCQEGDIYVPIGAVYHCPTCGRWWAWMTGLNITTITFGEPDA
jgi:hypothetical protein